MFKIINPHTIWFASLALLAIGAVGNAADGDQEAATQPTYLQQTSPAPVAPSPVAPSPTIRPRSQINASSGPMMSTVESSRLQMSDCNNCLHCRFNGNCRILLHDKCMFHWYIRGNGPAIHTRPAGIYWW